MLNDLDILLGIYIMEILLVELYDSLCSWPLHIIVKIGK